MKLMMGGTLIDGFGARARGNSSIVAVRGDVMRHIALLQRVDIVVTRGVKYKR